MVTFEAEELEIAIATYNRAEFIAEWLEKCFEQAHKRNISISIWDSSTNNETEVYVNSFKSSADAVDLKYYHVDSETLLGYKSMLPLLHSKSKYVWVSGDSRYHDFDCMDKKVFPFLKNNVDYVVMCGGYNNEENDGKIYTDKNEFFRDCFTSMTGLGFSIYRTSLFEPMKSDHQLRAECDAKFKNNYAFGWIGYFLKMFSLAGQTAAFAVVPIMYIKPDKKILSWFKYYYQCWIEDLCNLLDACSDEYQCIEEVIRETWIYLSHDVPTLCYEARKKGDLNQEIYSKYKENGMLDKCTKRGDRLKRFAFASDGELEEVFKLEQEIEKKEYETLCCQNMDRIKELSEGRELWIYGAGTGGKILVDCLAKHDISVCGFLDIRAENIISCEGIPVKKPEDIESANCFIVISLLLWKPFVVSTLQELGIERKYIFYLSVECD